MMTTSARKPTQRALADWRTTWAARSGVNSILRIDGDHGTAAEHDVSHRNIALLPGRATAVERPHECETTPGRQDDRQPAHTVRFTLHRVPQFRPPHY